MSADQMKSIPLGNTGLIAFAPTAGSVTLSAEWWFTVRRPRMKNRAHRRRLGYTRTGRRR